MTYRTKLILVILLAFSLAAVIPVMAAEMRGSIADIRPEKNEFVLTEAFKDLTFKTDNATRFFLNERECKLTDLRPGDAANVTYDKRGRDLHAMTVRAIRNIANTE